jgi:hypothetical protein
LRFAVVAFVEVAKNHVHSNAILLTAKVGVSRGCEELDEAAANILSVPRDFQRSPSIEQDVAADEELLPVY